MKPVVLKASASAPSRWVVALLAALALWATQEAPALASSLSGSAAGCYIGGEPTATRVAWLVVLALLVVTFVRRRR